jgi:hypothetical protein
MLELRDRWMAFRIDVILFCAVVTVALVTYVGKPVSASQLRSRPSVWGVA